MTNDVVDHNKTVHSEADEPGAAFDGIRQQLAAFDPFEIRVEELGWAPRATGWWPGWSCPASTPNPSRMPTPTNRCFAVEWCNRPGSRQPLGCLPLHPHVAA
jgi:hypothetical protein